MNTVLPARERPVTPRRRLGVPPPMTRARRLSATILASSVMVVMAGKLCSRGPIWGRGAGLQSPARVASLASLGFAGSDEGDDPHRAGLEVGPAAAILQDGQRGGREVRGKRGAVGGLGCG